MLFSEKYIIFAKKYVPFATSGRRSHRRRAALTTESRQHEGGKTQEKPRSALPY